MWENFTNLYTFIKSIIILLEHTLETFLNLLHFGYMGKRRAYCQLGQNAHH
jgi:hypothetical protein